MSGFKLKLDINSRFWHITSQQHFPTHCTIHWKWNDRSNPFVFGRSSDQRLSARSPRFPCFTHCWLIKRMPQYLLHLFFFFGFLSFKSFHFTWLSASIVTSSGPVHNVVVSAPATTCLMKFSVQIKPHFQIKLMLAFFSCAMDLIEKYQNYNDSATLSVNFRNIST